MRIKALERFRNRNLHGYFEDLPPLVRREARRWLSVFERRWEGHLPSWRRAILIGQAKRLALDPPSSEWGRRMRAKKGGLATQQLYRQQGRTGPRHPALYASRCSASKRRLRKKREAEAKLRDRLGLPPPPRSKYNSLD